MLLCRGRGGVSELARCRSERCGREILWCTVGGAPVPLDPVPLAEQDRGSGLVIYHAASGVGQAERPLEYGLRALESGLTLHTRHHATCPGVAEFSVNREQGSLW